jgi:eukaryotic-like serine/threonine-protein kinase
VGELLSQDDLPTRVERPVPERSTVLTRRSRRDSELRTAALATLDATIATPMAAVRADEVERFRVFYWAIVAAVVTILPALLLLEGDPVAKLLFAVSLPLYLLGASWLRWRVQRDPSEYHRDFNLIVAGIPGAMCGWAGMFYWGPFSPAPVVVAAALFINSLVGSRLYTGLLYGMLAVGHMLLAGAVMAGLVEDHGLIHADYASFSSQFITFLLIQFVMLVAFAGARVTRAVTLNHISALGRAAREMAQREALLNEAREELKRAAWVEGPGRFTGQVLGSFELGNVIGRGAMGEVYEAEHVETREPAAVKLLHRNVLAEPQHVERFAREAKAVALIDSPNVVKVLEVSGPDAPTPFLAMERLRGYDLAGLLRKRRRMDVTDVVELVDQIAFGLEAASEAGIVHRDLKPHNVFRADTAWKILDFGVSKLAESGGTLTSGALVGTPSYMSPEQARGLEVDHRSDVYALGAIAYRALTGHPPFPSRDMATTVHQVVYKMPERPGGLVTLPREIDAVLALALAKDRDERFQTALELARALRAAAEGRLQRSVHHRAERLLARHDWGKTFPNA